MAPPFADVLFHFLDLSLPFTPAMAEFFDCSALSWEKKGSPTIFLFLMFYLRFFFFRTQEQSCENFGPCWFLAFLLAAWKLALGRAGFLMYAERFFF